jgi:hypothetical protein
MEAMLKPFAWCELFGVRIIDADGWRVPGAPDWYDPISRKEFIKRLRICTIEVVDNERYKEVG